MCGGPSKGTSVLYSTLHCLIKYRSDQIAEYSSTLSENAICNGDLDFFIIGLYPQPPYDSNLTPFLSHLNFSFFTIEVLPGVWEYAWLRACRLYNVSEFSTPEQTPSDQGLPIRSSDVRHVVHYPELVC